MDEAALKGNRSITDFNQLVMPCSWVKLIYAYFSFISGVYTYGELATTTYLIVLC